MSDNLSSVVTVKFVLNFGRLACAYSFKLIREAAKKNVFIVYDDICLPQLSRLVPRNPTAFGHIVFV